MITIIDANTAAVDSFSDLRSVLQSANDYTTVHLAADIQMTAGIAILPSKAEVTIDGLYPTDGTGTVHTLTDYASSDAGYTLGVRSASSIQMTVRNMNIVGRNYYGILYAPEGAAYAGVTSTYQNIRYTGPQITYNPSGKARYIDCDITITAGASAANELAEVYQVELGGVTTINHTTPSGYATFWFRGASSSPSLTVLEGADVRITAAYDLLYTSNPVALAIRPGARLAINTVNGIARGSGHPFASVRVDAGAQFLVEQSATNGSATLYCNGAFTVGQGASVVMRAASTNTPALIRFAATGASLTLDNPRDFALYSAGNPGFYFTNGTALRITTYQYNTWPVAAGIDVAGGFDDPPPHSWRKFDGEPMVLIGSASNSGTTWTSHNFTDEELAALPAFTYMYLSIARVFSCGNLPLTLDPVAADGLPVTGTTAPGAAAQLRYTVEGTERTLTGAADADGRFSIGTDTVIPAGTALSAAVNIPFLLSYATGEAEEPGALTLDAPASLPFRVEPVTRDPVLLFGREQAGWTLRVTDTRIRGGLWYLYAAIDRPPTGENPAHTLPNSLVLVDDADGLRLLGETPVLVWTGTDNGGVPLTTAVSWQADRGILLQAVAEPFYNGERYTADITWTLTDAPL